MVINHTSTTVSRFFAEICKLLIFYCIYANMDTLKFDVLRRFVLAAIEEDDGLYQIRLLLLKWAELSRGSGYRGLGYPSESIEHKAVFGGTRSRAVEEWPQDVIDIESALTALGLEDKAALDAIKISYLKNKGYRQLGLELKMHWQKAKNLLQFAEHRVNEIYLEIKRGV